MGKVPASNDILANNEFYSLNDIPVKDANGKLYPKLGDLVRGKMLYLIVNVASNDKLTDVNYKELVRLHYEFKDRGFEIIAFPCNQFNNLEPASDLEIIQFAKNNYDA